jgi:hypothetical protein
MDWRSWTSWRRTLCCVLVPLAGAALAEEKPRPLDPAEKVTVSFSALVTLKNGATTRMLTMQQDLAVGQTMVGDAMQGTPFSFGVGGDPSGCGAQVTTQMADSLVAQHPFAWSADLKVLEASTDRLVLSISWKRFERDSDGNPVQAASEEIPSVELREGERVLLDLARPPGSSCFRNAALELTAHLREDPAIARRQLAYDLWLVHETKDGDMKAVRTQLTAGQGQQLPFAFPAEKLPALASAGRADETLQVTFTGKVRGRLRRDGGVELSISSERMLSYVALDGSNDGGIGDGGEKIVRVLPGEAIRIEIPPPAPGPAGGDPRAPRMTQDLAGHTFALVITAKAL